MYKKQKQQIHIIGIGGIGMSSIAEVLLRQGYPISGSDLNDTDTIRRLRELGATIFIGHRGENIEGAKAVVYSSAVNLRENPEVRCAQQLGIPTVARAEMLAELMRLKFGIAVAGTHGKTTTTSMIAQVLAIAGLDPTVIVGGKVDFLGSNAKFGHGEFLVAEADESDGSFLKLSSVLNVVTNIDNDHLEFYGQMESLRRAFLDFANKVPYYGCNILCADNREVRNLLPLITKPCITYGFGAKPEGSMYPHLRIVDYRQSVAGIEYTLEREGHIIGQFKLNVLGMHNALNATACYAIANEVDIGLADIQAGLAQFIAVRRRFENKGSFKGAQWIDDYAHHPTEVMATLQAARALGKNRVIVVFQPHRYSRTQVCWNQFPTAFLGADRVYLCDIYEAGEKPIEGVNSELLAKCINNSVYSGSLEATAAVVAKDLNDGDLIISMGAGSITKFSDLVRAI